MNWTKEKLDELAGAAKAAGELTPEDNPFNADGDEVDVKILYQAATDLPKILAALEVAVDVIEDSIGELEYDPSNGEIVLKVLRSALQAIKEVRG